MDSVALGVITPAVAHRAVAVTRTKFGDVGNPHAPRVVTAHFPTPLVPWRWRHALPIQQAYHETLALPDLHVPVQPACRAQRR